MIARNNIHTEIFIPTEWRTPSNLDPDNTTTSTSPQPEPQHTPVNRATMKPTPFYRTNQTFWFRQMESQFVLAGITNDTIKDHHILAAIPEDVAINLPMEIEDHNNLKDSITQVYQKSKTNSLKKH